MNFLKQTFKEVSRALLVSIVLIPILFVLFTSLLPEAAYRMFHRGLYSYGVVEDLEITDQRFIKNEDGMGVVHFKITNHSKEVLGFFVYELEFYDEDGVFVGEYREDNEGRVRVFDSEEASINFSKPWFIEDWSSIQECRVKVIQINSYGPSKSKVSSNKARVQIAGTRGTTD